MRTKRWSLGFAAAAPACGLMLAAVTAPASATAYLDVYDTNTGTYLCNDVSATDAALTCNGSIGSWTFTVDSGIDGSSGSLGKIDLDFDGIGTAPPSDQLDLLYFVDDLTGTGTTSFMTTLGGTADSGVSGDFESAFYNVDDPTTPVGDFCGQTGPVLYGVATQISTFCDQTGSFSGSQYKGGYPITGPYELGLLADLNLTNATNGIISGDFEVAQVPVPEPATLALFGAGLLGCALFLRRRRVPSA